jgi:general secretion pathway protein A
VYELFYGFKEEPFGVTPDPRFFYRPDQHEEAAASIYYSMAVRRGFAALIAEPGLGKTSIILSLLERLRDIADVVFLVHPTLDGECVLRSVLLGLGVSSHSEPSIQRQQFTEYLLELDRRGRSCVVILDEAQNLSVQTLESVRMLSNFEVPERKLLQFVLVGQPALADLLLRPESEQIRQRVNVIARLRPLSPNEVDGYIRFRLSAAGAAHNPFTPDAIRAIAAASGGVPRNINTLCFAALTLGFADANRTISAACVAEAVSDLVLEPHNAEVSSPGVRRALQVIHSRAGGWRRWSRLCSSSLLLSAMAFCSDVKVTPAAATPDRVHSL